MESSMPGGGHEEPLDAETAALVLGLVAHHCPCLTADPRDACALLQVSTWARRVLLECRSHSMAVTSPNLRNRHTLKGFAHWLRTHSSLVGTVRADRALWSFGGAADEPQSQRLQQRQQLVLHSLQHATATGPSAAAGSLRLRQFSSNYLHAAPILSTLPPAALTRLELSTVLGDEAGTAAGADFNAALTALSRLQQLSLGTAFGGVGLLPPRLLATLQALPRLAHLALQGAVVSGEVQQALSPQLHSLVLDGVSYPGGFLDLCHMSSLQRLDLAPAETSLGCLPHAVWDAAKTAAAALLPGQLQALTVLVAQIARARLDLFQVPQLEQLTVRDSHESSEWLQTAAAATAKTLTSLSLTYTQWRRVLAAAPTWGSLPQLQHLSLQGIVLKQPWQAQLVLESLASATGLTVLAINRLSAPAPLALCGALRPLTRLAVLSLKSVQLVQSDVSHLGALPGLKELRVAGCGSGAADAALTAICGGSGPLPGGRASQQQLQALSLIGGSLPLDSALGLITRTPQLKGLSSLELEPGRSATNSSGGSMSDASLVMLAQLKALTRLVVPGNADALSRAALEELRDAVPGLARDGLSIVSP